MPTQETRYTPEEIEKAAEVLRGSFADLGRFPTPLFYAVCETALQPTVELVITIPGTDKILMTEREQNDPYFPAGLWHVPGKMTAKEDFDGPYQNAIHNAALRAIDELEGTQITPLVPLSPHWLNQPPRISARGPEISFFYGAYLLDKEPRVGQMFDAQELPGTMLDNHRDIVERAPLAIHLAHASMPNI